MKTVPHHRVTGRRWRLLPLLVLALLLVAIAWLVLAEQAAPPAAVASASPAAPLRAFPLTTVVAADPLAARRRQLLATLQLSEHTYCSYRDSSKYPHSSRPIAEQPDQVYPNAAIDAINPLRSEGGQADPAVLLQSSQTRVYLAAGETVSFSLRAVDAAGTVLPLVITGASARALGSGGQRPSTSVPLAFVDDGSGADPVAGDGAFAATLAPAQSPLAAFSGTIRSQVDYQVGARKGSVAFDVIYSADAPALWLGPPRELLEEGSLTYLLRLEVRRGGRYLISGRVDDARGAPFALLNFNEVLAPGPQDIRLSVFGKLLRDQNAALPLSLRDVDGYLLLENSDPDRSLLPRLEGKLLSGQPHALSDFADAEWHSEERTRHLAEFANDARAARAAFAAIAPPPPPACPLPP